MTKGRTPEIKQRYVPTRPLQEPPYYLDKEGRKLYKTLAKQLTELACNLDTHYLAQYVVTHQRWLEADKAIALHGILIDGKANPAVKIADALLRQCRQYADALGLSPCGRGRIMAEPVTSEDDEFKLPD